MAALAAQRTNLSATVALARPDARSTPTARWRHLNASFPNTRAFAKEILPGVKETPATIDAALPWIAQARKLVSPAELGGLTQELQPATADLAKLVDGSLKRAAAGRPRVAVRDARDPARPATSRSRTGSSPPTWRTTRSSGTRMVGLAGEGAELRRQRPLRPLRGRRRRADDLDRQVRRQAGGELYGNVNQRRSGTRPAYPGKRSPYGHDGACKDQKLPDLNSAKTGPPTAASTSAARPARRGHRDAGHGDAATAARRATRRLKRRDLTASCSTASTPSGTGSAPMRMAIRKHRWDFIAIIGIFVIALAVGGYILGHQRFYLPKWVPVRRHRLRRATRPSSPPPSRSRRARARR